jgi:hypothetical protein
LIDFVEKSRPTRATQINTIGMYFRLKEKDEVDLPACFFLFGLGLDTKQTNGEQLKEKEMV